MLSICWCFSHETFAVSWYSNSLAFQISNQNHHDQTGSHYQLLKFFYPINRQFDWKKYHVTYMEPLTCTKWGLNNSNRLFWEIRTDTNFTTQNTCIHNNKYTSSMNRISSALNLNCMKLLQEMEEEWWFERNMTRCVNIKGSRG